MVRKTSAAFTLVEIMIVVAIIGIIIAIAVPAFLRARETSRATACQENLTKIDSAKEVYLMEKKAASNFNFGANWSLLTDPEGVAGTGYIKTQPECPAGGTYSINLGNVAPTCSYSAPIWSKQHTISQ